MNHVYVYIKVSTTKLFVKFQDKYIYIYIHIYTCQGLKKILWEILIIFRAFAPIYEERGEILCSSTAVAVIAESLDFQQKIRLSRIEDEYFKIQTQPSIQPT